MILKAHMLVITSTFLIAGSFIISQKLSGVIDPISLTLFRFVFASLLLAPIVLVKRSYRDKIKDTFPRAMVIGLFYSLFFIGLFKALKYTTVLNTGTLFTLVPLLTALFSILIFNQKMGLYQFLIYIIGIIGTCIVIFKGEIELFLQLALNKGDAIFLVAIIFMALYSISSKYFYKESDEVIVLVFMTLVGGVIWMEIALTILNIPLEWYKIKNELFVYMFYLTVGATLFTVYLSQRATIILGPKKVMAYIYINPAVITLLMFIFESKFITFWSFFGILISLLVTMILLIKD